MVEGKARWIGAWKDTTLFELLRLKLDVHIPGEVYSSRVETYLQKVDGFFLNSLSSRVNIKSYSLKISKYAYNFFLLDGEEDISHCAFYIDESLSKAYVTSISVVRAFSRRGIGSFLLKNVEAYLYEKGITLVELEADPKSNEVIKFYLLNGYSVQGVTNKFILEKNLELKR